MYGWLAGWLIVYYDLRMKYNKQQQKKQHCTGFAIQHTSVNAQEEWNFCLFTKCDVQSLGILKMCNEYSRSLNDAYRDECEETDETARISRDHVSWWMCELCDARKKEGKQVKKREKGEGKVKKADLHLWSAGRYDDEFFKDMRWGDWELNWTFVNNVK